MNDLNLQVYPIGTVYKTCGKYPVLCTVTDFLTTKNLAGDVVKTRYVATHKLGHQLVIDGDVTATAIARGI